MSKRNLIKYSKFYVRLEKIERQLRDVVDLGIHLKTATPELFEKLDAAAEAIKEYFDDEDTQDEKSASVWSASLWNIKTLPNCTVVVLGRIIKRFHEFNLIVIFDMSKYSVLRRSDKASEKCCAFLAESKPRATFY